MLASNDESHKNSLPRVGITIGDAAGIGPEITVRALSDPTIQKLCRPVVIGDARLVRTVADSLGNDFRSSLDGRDGAVDIVDLDNLPLDLRPGYESAATGRASGEYIEKAVDMCLKGEIDAVATAPISKTALNAGGYDYPGHTEFLARLTNTEHFAMSFFAGDLRVVLLSTHLSLLDAIGRVTKANLIRLIKFTDQTLSGLLGRKVRIALAGLNPHASENGMFGGEEAAEMIPAVDHCHEAFGIDVSGPFSPDTIFLRGFRGEFDVVIACYHDQATIAVKSLSFGSAVNVTIGLPIIRTSVDHGTAVDIAGKGIADASSMCEAIKLAAELAHIKLTAPIRK